MRTLEISAQFLALLQIPHATLSRSLHLSALHFPSAKFGERDPPSGLVCLGWEHTFILFYSSAVPGAGTVQEQSGGQGKLQGNFSGCAFTQAACLFQNTVAQRKDFLFKSVKHCTGFKQV